MAKARSVLSKKENFQLCTLLSEEYTSSGKSDREFFHYAVEKLGIPHLNLNHVIYTRKELEIPINGSEVRVAMDRKAMEGLLLGFNARLKSLEDRVEIYINGSRK